MNFNVDDIKTFEIVKEVVGYTYRGPDVNSGMDVKVCINGTDYTVFYTNVSCRSKMKQIEKYVSTKNPNLKQKASDYLSWMTDNGYGFDR